MTATYTHYNTDQEEIKTVLTDNQTGTKTILSHDSAGNQITLASATADKEITLSDGSYGTGVTGHINKIELENGSTIRDARFNTVDQSFGGEIEHADGGTTGISSVRSGTTIYHTDETGSHSVSVSADGRVGAQGTILRDADPTKEGVTATYTHYNTDQKEIKTTLTNNKTGNSVSVSKDDHGIQIRTEDSHGQSKASVSIDKSGISIQGRSGKSVNVTKVIGIIKSFTR